MMPVTELPIISASWQRCVNEYKLDPHCTIPRERLTDHEVRRRREKTIASCELTSTSIELMRSILRDAGCCALFADQNGVVVESFCESEKALSISKRGLVHGSAWDETLVGTNGIGTTLVERQATAVIGREHYNAAFRQFSCISAPIFGAEADLLGVITIAGDADISRAEIALLHHFLNDWASNIEAGLFRHRFQGNLIIGLSKAPAIETDSLQSLVALDENGDVIGASQAALRLLRARRDQILNQSAGALLGVTMRTLEEKIGDFCRLSTQTEGARYAWALPSLTLRRPALKPTGHSPRKRADLPPQRANKPGLTLDALAGGDARMHRNIILARRVCDAGLPILLQGETGSGKEMFAKAIHISSQRSSRPFVAVNCAAIPASLLDSELFGYEPGTFTGGLKDGKAGKVLASDGGTLFLDEIGDMPVELQTRLLRVLAEREVTPLGAVEPITVDLNLICATHCNLEEMVTKGLFREDLYYRINGVRVTLPPLRERDDLIDLIHAVGTQQAGGHPMSFSPDALEGLSSYPWPGNIRQLSNVMRLLSLTVGHARVEFTDLPDDVRFHRALPHPPKTVRPALPIHFASLKGSTETAQRAHIRKVLQESSWTVAEAARRLGVSRATLHRRIKEYGFERRFED